MTNICVSCGVPLTPGKRVVQLATGRYFPEYITPTYGDFVSEPEVQEWHEECFKEFNLTAQSGHNACIQCGELIQHSEFVHYITVGTKYSLNHVRLSRRGKRMPWIVHARNCGLKKAG